MNRILENIRALFPALSQKMNGVPLIYLDNAATSQKPIEVLELLRKMNGEVNANVHRAMYELSDRSTELYEGAREKVRQFINAPERGNVIFTSGTTASINLVASSFCRRFLKAGDAIVITADSHHSNIVPWQLAAESIGAEIRLLPINTSKLSSCDYGAKGANCGTSQCVNGELLIDKLEELLSDGKVKIVAATHISNVLGLVNPVERIIKISHAYNVPVLLDGAQGIVHEKVDVQALDCDFYAFSAHKIYGETGVGVLYGKREILEEMPPYMGGGDMVGTVTYKKTTYAELPLKFEAGTPNFIGASSLKPALEYAEYLREPEVRKVLKEEESKIKRYMFNALACEVGDVEIYGVGDDGFESEKKIPLFSFNVKGCNAGDIAQLLDKMGFAVRTGMMCAEPLLDSFGVNSVVRASFASYNTVEEAEKFIAAINRAKSMLL